MRSASAEDLSSIVKQIINGAPKNTEQVAKLIQVVCEEWYMKKMAGQNKSKAEIEFQDKKIPGHEGEEGISANLISHRMWKPRSIRRSPALQCLTTEENPANFILLSIPQEDFSIADAHNETHTHTQLSDALVPSSAIQNLKTVDLRYSGVLQQPNIYQENKQANKISNAPVVRTIRKTETGEMASTIMSNTNEKHQAIENHNRRHKAYIEDLMERIETEKTGESENHEPKVIVVWSNVKRMVVPVQDLIKQDRARNIPIEYRSRGEIAFENWKKEKTKSYNRFLEDQLRKRQRVQKARAIEMERKKTANEAYLHWRKQQQLHRKFSTIKKKALEESRANVKKQSDEKRTANAQVFKAWKRQKDVNLRERKLYFMANAQHDYQQGDQSKHLKANQGTDATFDIWLDQLDCVLHQKYLRERRYLVRSFYCQPAYYGTAALCTR